MDESKNESPTASLAALQAFGRQVGQDVGGYVKGLCFR